MGNTTSINLRIDKELKSQSEALFDKLGLNMTTAINVFLRQAVREQALPFKVTASSSYDDLSPYRGNAATYPTHNEYVTDSLRQSDMRVSEGKARYYTADEIISGLEEVLNETI